MANTSQTSESIDQPQFSSKHVHLPRVLLVLFVALLSGTVFGAVGYFLGMAQESKYAYPPTVAIAVKPTSKTASPSATLTIATSNWTTYTNKKQYFRFKYPKTLSVISEYVENDTLHPLDTVTLQTKDKKATIAISLNPTLGFCEGSSCKQLGTIIIKSGEKGVKETFIEQNTDMIYWFQKFGKGNDTLFIDVKPPSNDYDDLVKSLTSLK